MQTLPKKAPTKQSNGWILGFSLFLATPLSIPSISQSTNIKCSKFRNTKNCNARLAHFYLLIQWFCYGLFSIFIFFFSTCDVLSSIQSMAWIQNENTQSNRLLLFVTLDKLAWQWNTNKNLQQIERLSFLQYNRISSNNNLWLGFAIYMHTMIKQDSFFWFFDRRTEK